jgi:hypothetical protein
MIAAQKLLLFAAAASLAASCKLNPSVERTGSETEPAAPPPAAKSVAAPEPPGPARGAPDDARAPADGGFSPLAGMWHGKIVHYSSSARSPFDDDHLGAVSRVISAEIGPNGSVSLAVGKSTVPIGSNETGASSRCTIDGTIQARGSGWVFVESHSECTGHFALPGRNGLTLVQPCVLKWTNLDQRPAGGALFTLKRQGCRQTGKP